MDWENPGGERISIAVARYQAPGGKAIGSLLLNPGGPGASGVEAVDYLQSNFTGEVGAAYDMVGWDPRGTGHSVPVRCYDSDQLNDFLAWWPKTWDDATIAEAAGIDKDFGEACLERTGESLGYVDSVSTARDMDIIRAAVGDEKLNYVGFSYGTLLGQLYAEQYPDKVGRVVLDGVVDPAESSQKQSEEQMASFERSLRSFVEWCEGKENCPLSGGVDGGLKTIHDLIARAGEKPLNTDYPRKLDLNAALMGVLVTQYDDTLWEALRTALVAALQGDGTQLLELSDMYYERDTETGDFDNNMFEAFYAIGCLDAPVDASREAMDAAAASMKQATPTLGDFNVYGELLCANWPFPARWAPHAITAEGADPIVVVGTTGDPATPYESAVAVADRLASGVMVTYKGEGHTAIGRANECVNGAITEYLVNGVPPKAGLMRGGDGGPGWRGGRGGGRAGGGPGHGWGG
jgi:pimeloyl-ACP methyl ester carboxylesterase